MKPHAFHGWQLREQPRSVRFTVYGAAAPQGSPDRWRAKKDDGREITVLSEPKGTKEWKDLIGQVAQRHVPAGGPLDGPLVAGIVFYMPLPKSAPKTWLALPTGAPDADKLLRACLDPLRHVIIADDARVVWWARFGKLYSLQPRVEIDIWEARPEDLPDIALAAAEVGLRLMDDGTKAVRTL
ncbi:MAG: RusA family crossover junction endodeoxyribonuclease [Steroidobacteraceae bacterium]